MKEEPKSRIDSPSGAPTAMVDDRESRTDRRTERGRPSPRGASSSPQTPTGSSAPAQVAGAALDLPGSSALLSGAQKAAVFVLSLDEEDASRVLRNLTDEELGQITGEIAKLGVVEKDTVGAVLREFDELEHLHSLVREGGVEQAARLLERSFPKERAQRILQLLAAERQSLPFLFLQRVEIETLMTFLEEEHPQTLALVLAHMPPAKAAEVLERLPPESRRDVLQRIATLEGANAEALEEVELTLQKHLDTVEYERLGDAGGVKAVADILRAASGGGTEYLDDIRQDRPELAEEIGMHLFVFDDLDRLDDPAIQAVLKEVEPRILAIALKSASEGIRHKVLENLPRREAESLREEMELLGPVRMVDVRHAQREVLQTVLELEQAGQLYISGRGREENRIFY